MMVYHSISSNRDNLDRLYSDFMSVLVNLIGTYPNTSIKDIGNEINDTSDRLNMYRDKTKKLINRIGFNHNSKSDRSADRILRSMDNVIDHLSTLIEYGSDDESTLLEYQFGNNYKGLASHHLIDDTLFSYFDSNMAIHGFLYRVGDRILLMSKLLLFRSLYSKGGLVDNRKKEYLELINGWGSVNLKRIPLPTSKTMDRLRYYKVIME